MKDIFNNSHCIDTTYGIAAQRSEDRQRAETDSRRALELIAVVIRIANLSGFYVETLSVVSRKSGRRFRKNTVKTLKL